MSSILASMKTMAHITDTLFRKFKKDTHLASDLLPSVKSMMHGVFLRNGGAYSKKLYTRKLGETNAEKTLIKSHKVIMDTNTCCKKINEFLNAVNDASPFSPSSPKPKRITRGKKEENSVGNIVMLRDNILKMMFVSGEIITFDGPLLSTIYSPEEICCLLKEQIDEKMQNKVMKLVSNDIGVCLVPITSEVMRKAFYCFKTNNKIK
eukprot:6355681-Ditylum_brightwellii.AAC.1